jgi:hypothetical protein
VVRNQLGLLSAHRVPAEGQVLLHAPDHGAAGRLIDAPMSVNGSDGVLVLYFWGSGNVALAGAALCGQDREGPLRVEGRLLSGHAGSGSGVAGGGRQIDRRPAPGCGSRLEGQAAPGVGGCQSAAARRWG